MSHYGHPPYGAQEPAYPLLREVYYGTRFGTLETISLKTSAQERLARLRINIIGQDIDEFRQTCFIKAVERLHGLQVMELNPVNYEADLLCKRLVPYLLCLPELDHVPKIAIATRGRKLREHLQDDFDRLAIMLHQRNEAYLHPKIPCDTLSLLADEVRNLIRFAGTTPLRLSNPNF